MGDYDSYCEKVLQCVEETDKENIYNSICYDTLVQRFRQGEDIVEISYRIKNCFDGQYIYVRNVYILSGDDRNELQEIILCIQKCDNEES